MAKEVAIGIKIQTSGTEKVVKNLGDLENELNRLNTEIKTLDFGSPQFLEAQRNIQSLRSRVDEFDKATEGLGAEKNFNALGAAIGALTGTFQVATGVLGLFISEEEDLVEIQKAEAQALSVINLALGINTINKELVESRTKRAALAEKAYTIATNLSTAATKAFNAALKANPIGLVIAGIVALTAAIAGLVVLYNNYTKSQSQQEKQAKALLKVEGELIETKKKAGADLKVQLKILTDNVKTRALEEKTIEDLKKTYPGFNAFVDENNKLTKEGNDFLLTKIALQETEASLQAIREKKATAEIALAQRNAQIEQGNIGLLQTTISFLLNRNATLDAYVESAKEYGEATAGLSQAEEDYTKKLNEQLEQIKLYNKQLDEQNKREQRNKELAEQRAKALSSLTIELQGINAAITRNTELLDKEQAALGKYSSALLDLQKETLEKQKALLQEQGETLKSEGQKFIEELDGFLFATIPTPEELKKLSDGYADFFDITRKAFRSGDLDFRKNTGWEDFIKFAETKLPGIGESLANVNDESRQSFIQYFNSLDERIEKIQGAISATPGLDEAFNIEATPANLEKLIKLEEKIGILRKDQNKLGLTAEALRKQEIDLILKSFVGEEKLKKLRQTIFDNEAKLSMTRDENVKNRINKENEEIGNTIKNYEKLGASILDGIIKTNDFIVGLKEVGEQSGKNLDLIKKQKELIDSFTQDPGKLLTYFENLGEGYDFILEDLNNNLDKYLNKFGAEGVSAILEGISTGVSDVEFETRAEVQRYITLLESVGSKISTALRLGGNPFQPLVDQLKGVLKSLPKEASSIQKFLGEAVVDGLSRKEIVEEVLAAYTDISNRLSNIVMSNNAMVLESIQYQTDLALSEQDKLLKQAQGNEKEIAKIEAEKQKIVEQQARKRFDVEKKARVSELRFSQFQAAADASQAILNALANIPAPFGAIYAATLGAITAVQVRQIEQQLNATQSQVFVGRRGGAVMGGSHEQGGVPALLEGGEFIMNKEAVSNFSNEIQSINNATGGRPMAIDDSRLVQAIATQNLDKKQPLKTYVLFQDIKDTEKLNNKISQLSRL